MSEKFQKRVEDFNCSHCRNHVIGNGFTDHCPRCLYSQHVDINPGDRQSQCKGLMKPIDIAPHKSGYRIGYRCLKCGFKHSNKSSDDDDITTFIENS